ncbi:hypothetical protein Lfu02_69400 [Longispora fulva]|uniref:Uncharacterized protein n=1 Tax=Longispora fulva TaxID=619741 RepID=A0A8J7GPK5_9ACTN|nr:hypothetical protein [Longispora fulva]MBG6134521.1 hypothetical protein [Longispora fulva]GIG62568.1 hypothetical protein Lfu02_69400 [Longispora fulva]
MICDEARERLVGQLRQLDARELVDVLREVLPLHDESEGSYRATLILAQATLWARDAPEEDHDPADLSAVAWPDRAYYGNRLGPDQGFWEDGQCKTCGLPVTSNAKRAQCPACGSACQLT